MSKVQNGADSAHIDASAYPAKPAEQNNQIAAARSAKTSDQDAGDPGRPAISATAQDPAAGATVDQTSPPRFEMVAFRFYDAELTPGRTIALGFEDAGVRLQDGDLLFLLADGSIMRF